MEETQRITTRYRLRVKRRLAAVKVRHLIRHQASKPAIWVGECNRAANGGETGSAPAFRAQCRSTQAGVGVGLAMTLWR